MKTCLLKEHHNILEILRNCWSLETSSRYTPDNPSRGQCSVTSLVIQDHFGGEIMKTRVGNIWHFYNKIGDRFFDFTSGQFDHKIHYDHILSCRAEAFQDTDESQYYILSLRFTKALSLSEKDGNIHERV
jgi:hypothetical protein